MPPGSEDFLIEIFHYLIVILAGLALGSFAGALQFRIPRGLSWVAKDKDETSSSFFPTHIFTRSRCAHCYKKLRWADLIPVLSWLWSDGKSQCCGRPISPVYPLIELTTMVACLTAYAKFGWSMDFVFVAALTPFLSALAVIDLRHKILPNELIVIIASIGCFWFLTVYFSNPDLLPILFNEFILAVPVYGFLAWFVGWSMSKVLRKHVLGGGDVKFFAAAGLWLGLGNLSIFCVLAGTFGVIFAIFWRALRNEKLFPFGPALITSFFLLLLLSHSLLTVKTL